VQDRLIRLWNPHRGVPIKTYTGAPLQRQAARAASRKHTDAWPQFRISLASETRQHAHHGSVAEVIVLF
jgi:hypothetical protein